MPPGRPRKVVSAMTETEPNQVFSHMIESVDETFVKVDENAKQVPSPTSPEWTDYVLSLLNDDEKDADNGYPKTEGLKRISKLILGPIVVSRPEIFASTSTFAAVRHIVVFKTAEGELEFGGVGDAWYDYERNLGNCDPPYNKFPLACASTRALGRAIKDALQIKTVVAEEVSEKAEEGIFISNAQKSALNILCKSLKIHTKNFVNMGKQKYEDIEDIPRSKAQQMLVLLNSYKRGENEIPDSIKLGD